MNPRPRLVLSMMGGRREVVRAVLQRHRTQPPQRTLQPLRQRLEALREAQRRRLDIRVGEHEVVAQVRKRLAGNAHSERPHLREVRLAMLARTMLLREHNLPLRTRERPPAPESTLQRAQLPALKSPRIPPSEHLE